MRLPFCMLQNVKNVEVREEQSSIKGQKRREGENKGETEGVNILSMMHQNVNGREMSCKMSELEALLWKILLIRRLTFL